MDLLLPKWSPAMKFRGITSCPGYPHAPSSASVLTGLWSTERQEMMTGEQKEPSLLALLVLTTTFLSTPLFL